MPLNPQQTHILQLPICLKTYTKRSHDSPLLVMRHNIEIRSPLSSSYSSLLPDAALDLGQRNASSNADEEGWLVEEAFEPSVSLVRYNLSATSIPPPHSSLLNSSSTDGYVRRKLAVNVIINETRWKHLSMDSEVHHNINH
eukprot:GHVS01010481.1.p1 GENE.GHVS01010481.1~~GHVS01010481.1.p1  ORF type:complete len:141 (+),score=22.37 GHVS01010481.1:172-594(+)